jgi:hypothetical protein
MLRQSARSPFGSGKLDFTLRADIIAPSLSDDDGRPAMKKGRRARPRTSLLYTLHTVLILGAVATGVSAYMTVRRLINIFVA